MTSIAKREPTEAEAWKARREWVSRNRWPIGVAGLITAGAILWPHTSAAPPPPPPPAPTPPAPTPPSPLAYDAVRLQTEQQKSLGETIGLAAFAVVTAGVIYVATSDAKEYRPTTQHVPSYRFIAPSAPTRSVWTSWVSDW